MEDWDTAESGGASSNRGKLVPVVVVAWIAVAYGLLSLMGTYTFELYFTVSFIGFLVIGFLFAPPQTSRRWWSLFRLLTVPALLVFGYIVFQRVMTVVQG